MDFKELEYMIVIAQEKNISKAAERLYVSQSALSQALLKVEDRLGVSLFARKNRQYIPTCEGELYLEMCFAQREILNTRFWSRIGKGGDGHGSICIFWKKRISCF